MNITAVINGQPVAKIIPVRWADVSFGKFLKLAEAGADDIKVLSALLDIDTDTLRRANISNLSAVLDSLAFMQKPMTLNVPQSVMGFAIPKDLNLTEVGRYEDMKLLLDRMPKTKEALKADDLKVYLDVVAVYAMPNYLDSSEEDKTTFARQFAEAPCEEVMAIGNFTLVRLIASRLNTKSHSLRASTPLKNFRLALTVWLRRLAFTVRYYFWRRKLRTSGMNF